MTPKKRPHEDLNQISGPSTSQNESSPEHLVTNEQPKEEKIERLGNKSKSKKEIQRFVLKIRFYLDWKLRRA